MSACHLLTRLLLIASLILNGSGLGLVSVGDMAMHSPPPGDQVVTDVSDGQDVNPPCHESMDHGDTRDEAVGAPPSNPGDANECCESGSCLHACHQQLAPTAMALAFRPSMVIESQQASGTLASAHDSPALHRLIRPPIA
ncbi:MAG: CopL family metal-binding regulatory protein [Pseudoxanthomonas sp.]